MSKSVIDVKDRLGILGMIFNFEENKEKVQKLDESAYNKILWIFDQMEKVEKDFEQFGSGYQEEMYTALKDLMIKHLDLTEEYFDDQNLMRIKKERIDRALHEQEQEENDKLFVEPGKKTYKN